MSEVANVMKADYLPLSPAMMSTVTENIDPSVIIGVTESLRLSMGTKSISLTLLVLQELPALDLECEVDVIVGQCDLENYTAMVKVAESATIAATQMRKLTEEERRRQEERRGEQQRQTEARERQEREARELLRRRSQANEQSASTAQQHASNQQGR